MQKVLFIGVNWPEPSTAAGTRIMKLIHTFLNNKNEVTFASTAAESELSFDLNKLELTKASIKLNDSSFDIFIAGLAPTVVVYDRFLTEEQFGWRVTENAPNAVKILDTEDLHSLRTVRQKLFKNKQDFSVDAWLQEDVTKREIASIYRCDISLVISSFEMQLLKEHLKIDSSLLLHLPFMVDAISNEVFQSYPSFKERKDFICIGNGKHAPNVDAIIWLKTTIWPLIKKQLPEANLHIYGSYFPQQVVQMHKPNEGFYVEGFTADLENTFTNARINLAPLRFGAGLKGKLIDGMRFGTPNITTKIGVEGMAGALPFNGRVSDDAVAFAANAVLLYKSEEQFSIAQQNGKDILNQLYNLDAISERFINAVQTVTENLKKHRASNFIGSLLQHQTMQSSKFMSKWIEIKNLKNM
ncbi:glycosyltransferase [Cellulophaga sp. HaHaR_3_176]|uniref:glycosyltransferase n=1 Tax=Cellulophaga sp. HaHaR_3_176 TaxID=1942464 RepID=UPI001C1FAB32|nr:glycosyltransferase [Cellulophaga sp. HaHaR_3_176]QWX85305.1 glycosyltransferase [Cellulophaga sp. HaHaR_3_176]